MNFPPEYMIAILLLVLIVCALGGINPLTVFAILALLVLASVLWYVFGEAILFGLGLALGLWVLVQVLRYLPKVLEMSVKLVNFVADLLPRKGQDE